MYPRLRFTAVFAAVIMFASLGVPAGHAATASLSVTALPSPATLDLTVEGTTDWVSWVCSPTQSAPICWNEIVTTTAPYARKNVAPVIQPVVADLSVDTGGTAALRYLAAPTADTSWSDGDPSHLWVSDGAAHPSGLNRFGMLQTCPDPGCGGPGGPNGGVGTGFTFNVVAPSTAPGVLTLHVGAFRGDARLTVSMPGTADQVIDETYASNEYRSFEIDFAAAQAGDVLSAKWALTSSFGNSSNVWIHAATLAVEDVIDSDGDGVPDDDDAFPNSDLSPTVAIDGCDSGAANHLFANGATMNDLIAEAAANASNHGEFVSAVSALANDWKKAGLISGKQKGKIVSCSAKADIP